MFKLGWVYLFIVQKALLGFEESDWQLSTAGGGAGEQSQTATKLYLLQALLSCCQVYYNAYLGRGWDLTTLYDDDDNDPA